jgi:hypothetical protein
MEKLEIKNLEIEFNGIVKIIPISEDFAKEIRVWNEFASMCLETMFEGMPKQSDDDNNVFVLVSQEAAKAFLENQSKYNAMEEQYIKYDKKMQKKLILFIEKHFETKVNKRYFYSENIIPDEEDLKKNITEIIICDDEKPTKQLATPVPEKILKGFSN